MSIIQQRLAYTHLPSCRKAHVKVLCSAAERHVLWTDRPEWVYRSQSEVATPSQCGDWTWWTVASSLSVAQFLSGRLSRGIQIQDTDETLVSFLHPRFFPVSLGLRRCLLRSNSTRLVFPSSSNLPTSRFAGRNAGQTYHHHSLRRTILLGSRTNGSQLPAIG